MKNIQTLKFHTLTYCQICQKYSDPNRLDDIITWEVSCLHRPSSSTAGSHLRDFATLYQKQKTYTTAPYLALVLTVSGQLLGLKVSPPAIPSIQKARSLLICVRSDPPSLHIHTPPTLAVHLGRPANGAQLFY